MVKNNKITKVNSIGENSSAQKRESSNLLWKRRLRNMKKMRLPNAIETREDYYFMRGLNSLRSWKPMSFKKTHYDAQVIDMFCGSGGMSLGFAALGKSISGFELIGGVDLNKISLESYARNYHVPAIQADVRELAKSKSAVQIFLKSLPRYDAKRPIILIGCAPCQGFTAHRKKHWDVPDVRNGLVEAFADVAVNMMPECVIMENVPELLSGRYWPHFEYFRDKLQAAGYTVKQKIHNAATQGVPQERFRALIIAVRGDFTMPKSRLDPVDFVTVEDAISKLESVEVGVPSKKDKMHRCAAHRSSTIDVIKAVPKDGGSRPDGVGPKCLQGFKGYADVYGRLSWQKPSITITHYARNPASGRFVHPEQHRGLTMREAARLQSFPDGFEFNGGFDDVFRQIGEAVPPLLSLATAASVLAMLRKENSVEEDDTTTFPVNDSFAGVIAGIKSSRKCAV